MASVNPKSVISLGRDYFKYVDLLEKHQDLYLVQVKSQFYHAPPKPNVSQITHQYEIIYSSFKLYSMLRTDDLQLARTRFTTFKRIVHHCFEVYLVPTSNTGRDQCAVLNRIVTLANEHPDWSDVYIASYACVVEFFKSTPGLTKQELLGEQHPPQMYTPLHWAINKKNKDIVRLILHRVDRLDEHRPLVDAQGNTILHAAVEAGVSFLKLILQTKGARSLVSVRNHKGYTAFDLTCSKGLQDCCKSLLTYGMTVPVLTVGSFQYSENGVNRQSSNLETSKSKYVFFTKQELT